MGGVLVLAFVHMWMFATLAEDAFITFRYSLNLAQGNGPVFNAGERVEANTSTIWTYLIYLGGWVTVPVLGAAPACAPCVRGRRSRTIR